MQKNLTLGLGMVLAINVATTIFSRPVALNDAYTIVKNVSAVFPVLNNDYSTSVFWPIMPNTLSLVDAPTYGTAFPNGNGTFIYMPFPGFVGQDSFTYSVCNAEEECATGTVYITVYDPNAESSALCFGCCGCFDAVNECLCTNASFNNFTQVSGAWNQVNNHVETAPGAGTFNFLKYNTPVDQTYEILEFKISFPTAQDVSSPFISAGIVTNWDGSNETNQKVAYLSFDNTSGNPTSSKLALGSLNSGETIFFLQNQLRYNYIYTVRLYKNQQNVYAFIDDTCVGYSSNGLETGNFLGFFSFQAHVQFSDLKSCSYTRPVNVPPCELQIP